LHVVPANVTDDEAVFAEPLAAAGSILEQVPVHPTDRVVVIGPGKLGNLCAQVLALTGARVQVIGRRRSQLDLLARLGMATGGEETIAPHRADLVIECTGNPAGLELARRAVRPRGTIVLKSTYTGDAAINFSSIVVDEVTLMGSRCGSISAALRLLAKGVVDVKPLIAARYPLGDVEEALRRADQPGMMKVLVRV
jgi:threonine dehydrogenase-like Zn-dependent dehydrogenase